MKLTKRTQPHFSHASGEMVLVASHERGRTAPRFPPSAYADAEAQSVDVHIGPVGDLYTYTVVHAVKDMPPYGLAMVDFSPGVRAFGRLLHHGRELRIGQKVRIVPFELPDGAPDYAFTPV